MHKAKARSIEESAREIITLRTAGNDLEVPGSPDLENLDTPVFGEIPDILMNLNGITIKGLKTEEEESPEVAPSIKKKSKTPKDKAYKKPKDKTPVKSPSDTFMAVGYKYAAPPEDRNKNMISYIEESFKLKNYNPIPMPKVPKKPLFISLGILTIAFACIIIGTVTSLTSGKTSRGIPFWVIGTFCLLPGVFYALRFCCAFYSRTGEGRQKALEDVPQE